MSYEHERWLPIAGYDGLYEVSDKGRVKSLDRIIDAVDGRRVSIRGRVLKPRIDSSGHRFVTLCSPTGQRFAMVHRLVLGAFVGPGPAGAHGLHWDDNPANNQLANLRYGTQSDNMLDRVRNGNDLQANQTHCVNGHEFTPHNTIRRRSGGRKCKECLRLSSQRVRARKREAGGRVA